MVNPTPRPFYPRERDPVPLVEQAGWAPVPGWTGAGNLVFTGIRSLDCPARRESIHLIAPAGTIYCHVAELTMLKITWLHHTSVWTILCANSLITSVVQVHSSSATKRTLSSHAKDIQTNRNMFTHVSTTVAIHDPEITFEGRLQKSLFYPSVPFLPAPRN